MRRRLRLSLGAGVVVATVAIIECFAPTEITLQITTDIPCASLDGVAVIVGPPNELETRDPSTVTTMCDANGIGTLVVTPSSVSGPVGIAVIAGTKGPPDVAAESCRAQNYLNCVVARRELSFITHTPLTLPIELSSACENFPCPSDANNVQTCAVINGIAQCVGASIDSKLCEDASASCGPTGDAGVVIADVATSDAAAPGSLSLVVAGGNSSCAEVLVNASKQWWCWGANDVGQLAIDSGGQSITKPTHATNLDNYTFVALGTNHGCGLDGKGTVECWGANASGQLGDGSMTAHIAPATTNTAATVVQVGDEFSCALTDQGGGTIVCWGDNSHGQLGTGNNTSSMIPLQAMTNLVPFSSLGTGGQFACADSNGILACWGDDTFDQLDETGTSSTTIVSTGVSTDGVFALGTQHACAVSSATTLTCWGDNDDHQANSSDAGIVLGNPIQLATKIGAAAAGAHHTCLASVAMADAGNVMCVGDNTFGQVGNGGAQVTALTPVSMNGFAGSMSAGYTHTCVVVGQDNTVYCWGNNANGQLGDGTTTTRSTPVPVAW